LNIHNSTSKKNNFVSFIDARLHRLYRLPWLDQGSRHNVYDEVIQFNFILSPLCWELHETLDPWSSQGRRCGYDKQN